MSQMNVFQMLGHTYIPNDYIRNSRPCGMAKWIDEIEWHVSDESTWWNTNLPLQARLLIPYWVIPYLYHNYTKSGENKPNCMLCCAIISTFWWGLRGGIALLNQNIETFKLVLSCHYMYMHISCSNFQVEKMCFCSFFLCNGGAHTSRY
jgi:hypothetical protein